MTAALDGRGYVSDPVYEDDQVVAGEWRHRRRRSRAQRLSAGADFTRGLFGF